MYLYNVYNIYICNHENIYIYIYHHNGYLWEVMHLGK